MSESVAHEPSDRTGPDRCPGVFATHAAADGALARIRLTGGTIAPGSLELLAEAAAEHGDGFIEITGRANLQLRGITDVAAVADAVIAAGLAPSSTHDKVRNIEVSPLTGRIGGQADMRPVATALEAALRTDPDATALSGRFLFGLDDGRGDIIRQAPDAVALARGNGPDGPTADLLAGSAVVGSAEGTAHVVAGLSAIAHALHTIAPDAWRISDLDAADHARLVESVSAGLDPVLDHEIPMDERTTPLVGWFDQDDGSVLLGGVVELARIPARLAQFVAAIDAPVVITPDREILICDLTEEVAETVVRVLAPMGLIFDANSPWAMVSCCAGSPGCANGLAPVRADLLEHVREGAPITEREHWVGCARGCGTPTRPHTRVQATGEGYRRDKR